MISLDTTDTIAAIGSPPQGGWRGLVRVTGPEALPVATLGFEAQGEPSLQHLVRAGRCVGRLQVAGLRRPVAVELNVWPGSKTYTGQPLVEVQTTGSPPILSRVLTTFLERGARLAEPGEFTLRAFLAGRIDLTQSEAVLGVIDAQNARQLEAALQQLAGGLARPLTELRDFLVDTLAHLEANLDFADEADVDPLGRVELARVLDEQAGRVADLASRLRGRDRPSQRPRVVLVGPPNAGKSRLFNALIGQDQAIVAAVAGTTRDYLAAECGCNGLTIDLVDTAGEEAATTAIGWSSQAGRASQVRAADLILDCAAVDAGSFRTDEDHPPDRIFVRTKADLSDPAQPDPGRTQPEILTSSLSGAGLPQLRSTIATHFRAGGGHGMAESVASTSARSAKGLAASACSLASAAEAVRLEAGDELVAVDLRQAVDELGRIVGAVVTDDLLDRIFRRFCIGK